MSGRVLVTGANGVIGRATVRHLLANGYEVTALSTDEGPSEVRTVVADATSTAAVAGALDGCDGVVHLAALAHPSLGTPREVFANNVVSTFTVLSLTAERGIRRAVVASSINASGIGLNPHAPMPAYFPLDEDVPEDIADGYSLSKRVDELSAAMVARTWGMTVIALRFPLVRPLPGLAVIGAETALDPASMMRTGWAYLSVDDAARAVLCSLRAPVSGAHIVGLSATDTLLDRPTEELLEAYAPGVTRRRPFPGRAALVDTTRAQQLLAFEPEQSVHGGR